MEKLIIILLGLLYLFSWFLESFNRYEENKSRMAFMKKGRTILFRIQHIFIGWAHATGYLLGLFGSFTIFGASIGSRESLNQWLYYLIVIGTGSFTISTLYYIIKIHSRLIQNIANTKNYKLPTIPFFLWVLLMIAVPLCSMYLVGGEQCSMNMGDISPTKYNGNDTIFSQILQEVANTDATVRRSEFYIRFAIREESQRLYKTIVTGITTAALLLGLLILYRTRKPDKSE